MESLLSLILGILFLPITLLASWVVVHPQEEAVVLIWGRFNRLIKTPGLYWINVFGRNAIKVTTKRQVLELPRTTVADGNGNPIVIAGVVTYQYVDSIKVALEIEDAHEFVKIQAMAVLKQVASKYPYESRDGHSLKAEAQVIGQEMVRTLQAKVDAAGVAIAAYELSDLSYAPEIAQSMLIRQQATALVDARKIIVEGAVEIVREAVELLAARGLEFSPAEKSRTVSNLLTVICGEARVQPTYSIQSHAGAEADPELDRKMLDLLEKIGKNTTPKG